MHYFRNTSTLKDGDLVLMDFAPDYRYYDERYRARLARERQVQRLAARAAAVRARVPQGGVDAHPPRGDADEIMKEAAKAMEPVFARTTFSKPIYEKAARTLVERGGGVFSHTVGMAVHDVGSYRCRPVEAGPGLLHRPAAPRARGESVFALRGHRRGDADTASRTSRTFSRWSSTTWRGSCARRGSCSRRRRCPPRRSGNGHRRSGLAGLKACATKTLARSLGFVRVRRALLGDVELP